ncbi:MAG TPA: acyl-CoA dehydrogenase family protein [Nevskiaceae bacterium]|nr:acyl-CoA dehydrogenase family protein [Nevskiaceae bacterium]
MHFALTEDQQMIRDAAERFLAEAVDATTLRRALESASGYDEAIWRRIGSELGWCGIAIPEKHGGLGLGPVELVLVQEQAGRRLLPSPFFSSVCLAAMALREIATDAAQGEYLPRIADGSLRASAPLPSSGWGQQGDVPDGATASVLFMPREVGGELGLFAIEPRQARITPLKTWDATRRFARVEPIAQGVRIDDPSRAGEGVLRAIALARLYIAAEQLGGAQQCLDSTVAYVANRKQFGRAIASFQAVKHRCARMMVAIEATRSMVYGAAAVAASGADTAAIAFECAAAKALASETYFDCAQEAIQLHGGVGFTWEFDAHLHFKRAQASSHWLGSADVLHDFVAQPLFGTAP